MTDTPKIPDDLIERVARRMCVARGFDPDGAPYDYNGHNYTQGPTWETFKDIAANAIAARMALDEVMGPDKATLLAVADAADQVASRVPESPSREFLAALRDKIKDAGADPHVVSVAMLATSGAFREFAAALRAKAKGETE